TKTNITDGGAPRETEEGDEAMGTMQGDSKESSQNDYSDIEALEKQTTRQEETTKSTSSGEANQYAVEIWQGPRETTAREEADSRKYREEVDPYRRRLAKTIEKVLDHKRNAPVQNLLAGDLSQKLFAHIVENNLLIFYKKT